MLRKYPRIPAECFIDSLLNQGREKPQCQLHHSSQNFVLGRVALTGLTPGLKLSRP